MAQKSKRGGKETTIVRGADGALYVADKKNGKLTKLPAADAKKVNDFIAKAEDDLSKLVEGIPMIGGGVNLCVPDIFP